MQPNFKSLDLKLLAAFSLAVLLSSTAFAGEDGQRGKKQGHHGPPQEAIEACADLSADQACEFVSRRGVTLTGVCFAPPRDDAVLACRPENHRSKHQDDGKDQTAS
ncbi:MAG: hypothetical protein ACI9FR_003399 [Cryomorphaceae bacterium]|jgi:hypothetical protein